MTLEAKGLAEEISVQEQVVERLAEILERPVLNYWDNGQGFRFTKPGPLHFCVLKAARCVSGLNACLRLLPGGFAQEIPVLIRCIAECTTQIDFVAAGFDGERLAERQQKFISAYFSDSSRASFADYAKVKTRQREIHDVVGRYFDDLLEKSAGERPLGQLMSDVYKVYSGYVHSRYPEVMDLFGGNPGRFHLNGMAGTPKDDENIESMRQFVESVSITLRHVVFKFGLSRRLAEPHLRKWYGLSA